MGEDVIVGFSAPGTVRVEVDDPTDTEEVLSEFVEQLEQMDDISYLDCIERDPEWLAENVHYADGTDGEVYHEW